MERRRGIIVGTEYYGRYLAKLINEQSSGWQMRYRGSSRMQTVTGLIDAWSADAIISVGGPGPHGALVDLARRRNIPVVVIWMGSDVHVAKGDPHLLEVIKNYRFVHLTDGPWLIEELRALGIDARYVPITAVEPAPAIAELPQAFSVLTSLPEPHGDLYGERALYEIAAELRDIQFTVVGRGERNGAAPPNVRFAGEVADMRSRIDASTVLLRLPKHDGKSMLVLEALARGRHVVWTYDFPGVHHAPRINDAMMLLRALKSAHDAGALEPNAGGYVHVARLFGRAGVAAGFETALDAAVRDYPIRAPGPRHVAISGLELFTAQVARELDARRTGWLADPLRLRGTLEVASSMLSLASCEVWYSIGTPIGDRWLHLLARMLGKPRVIHWVGSDITTLRVNPGLRRWCRHPNVQNLAEAAWTIEELRELGIDAKLAPLPPRLHAAEIRPLPRIFTVLFYLPKTRGEFYGRREYERLVRAFTGRNIRFYVVGGGEFYAPPGANVTRLGWQTDLERIYAESSTLVRFTARDGLSLMTLEALAAGRHVIWTKDFPYVTRAGSYDELERALTGMLDAHERGELVVQKEAAQYIAQTYSTERCIETIVTYWDEASGRRTSRPIASTAS